MIANSRLCINYKAYRSKIKSFGYLNCVDKITFNPKSWFFALIGHTARVFEDKDTKILYVYESTTLNVNRENGVQISLLSDWLKARKCCHVMYRPLMFLREFDEFIAYKDFKKHIEHYRGRPYPNLTQRKWRWYVANAAVDFFNGISGLANKDQDSYFFCTQLSAHLDRYCKIIGEHENPAEYEPDDCREGGKLEAALLGHVKIGKEVEIVYE